MHGSRFPSTWPHELHRNLWHCYVCYILPLRFPPVVACGYPVGDDTCRLVKGHRPPCKGAKALREEKVDDSTRDGDPKLAGAKPRRHPMFEKRRRDGPHRSTA